MQVFYNPLTLSRIGVRDKFVKGDLAAAAPIYFTRSVHNSSLPNFVIVSPPPPVSGTGQPLTPPIRGGEYSLFPCIPPPLMPVCALHADKGAV